MDLYTKIQEAVAFIVAQLPDFQAQVAVILGTGLHGFTDEIEIIKKIPYSEIPHFLVATAPSHAGRLIIARCQNVEILVLAGRFHYYEGYDSQETTFPVRVLKQLKIKRLIITNAVGSVQAHIKNGDLVLIKDHINLQPANPLRGQNDERLGVRFPDMSRAYDIELNKKCLAIAQNAQIVAHEGVYVATQGPNLETPAEYRFFNIIGGDVVGMSAVAEVIVAQHANLPVLVISVVSNQCFPIENIAETTIQEVIKTVENAEPKLSFLIKKLLQKQIF